jgi:hypothetical protein
MTGILAREEKKTGYPNLSMNAAEAMARFVAMRESVLSASPFGFAIVRKT